MLLQSYCLCSGLYVWAFGFGSEKWSFNIIYGLFLLFLYFECSVYVCTFNFFSSSRIFRPIVFGIWALLFHILYEDFLHTKKNALKQISAHIFFFGKTNLISAALVASFNNALNIICFILLRIYLHGQWVLLSNPQRRYFLPVCEISL